MTVYSGLSSTRSAEVCFIFQAEAKLTDEQVAGKWFFTGTSYM